MKPYARVVPWVVPSMQTCVIVGEDGREHEIEKDYKNRLFIRAIDCNSPCYMKTPDQEHRYLSRLCAKAEGRQGE